MCRPRRHDPGIAQEPWGAACWLPHRRDAPAPPRGVLECGRGRGAGRRPGNGTEGRAMRNYGIIGTLVTIILVIVVLRLLGVI